MNRIFALLLNMLCLVIGVQLFAQTPVRMHIKDVDAAKDTLIRDFDQMIDARKFLQNWQQQSIRKGHLAASIDTLYLKDSIWQAILFTGPAYKWVKLNLDKLSPPLKQELGLDERQWENKALDPYKLDLLQQKILNYCENNGYPFAQTQLEFHSRSKSGIEASLLLHQGAYIQLDSIVVSSNIALNPSFLYQYLELYPGAAYDERKLKQISKKIKELEFVAEEKPWEMHFSIGKNTLYLFLKEKKSNQLNALIGLQPNTEATQRFMLTAEAELALKNSFGMAESIGLSFQNLQFQSPRLQVNALLPYMLGTRFGADVTFDLY